MAQELPRTIGRYEVVDRVGRGGMGVVFRARDPRIGRNVAIKLLSVPDESLRDRFLQEAQSVGGLTHRNIVTIFDFGEHEGQSYIVMEFVEGVTLAEQIHDNVPIPMWRKLEIVEELASGLDYAHNKGIVHRDIKPANVMTDREGVVKILDFGIARVGNITMTQAGMMLGTPNYMSPEQFESGRVDRRSDIFSVGVLFYELLTYRKAFSGEQVWDVMKAVVGKAPVPLSEVIPGIDPAVEAAVNRAIEKNPANRYQTLAEMHADIAKVKSRLAVKLASPLSITSLTPTPDESPRTPRPMTDRAMLSKRRAERVEAYLNDARRAFDAGEYGTAVEACDQALLLDPDDPRVHALIEQARQALDRQQAVEVAADARGTMERGELTRASALVSQALQLDPASGDARDLKALIDDRIRKRDAERKQRQQEHEAAVSFVAEQKREFAAGNWHKAIGKLEKYSPRHEVVVAALADFRTELAEIDRRTREEEAQRQREAAEAQRRWVARQLDLAKRAIAEQQFVDAVEILEHVQRNSQNAPGLAELMRQAQAGRAAVEDAARRTREIASILERADADVARGKLIEARSLIASALTIDPAHPEALARLRDVKNAIEGEERRKAHDRDADRAVGEARRRFDAGDHTAAIRMLQTFAPVHQATTRALDELKSTLANIERQKEEAARKREAERARREREEAERIQRGREAATLVADARTRIEAKDLSGAADRIQKALAIDPSNADAAQATVLLTSMRERLEAGKATAIRPAPPIPPPSAPAAPTPPAANVTKSGQLPAVPAVVSGGLAGPPPAVEPPPPLPPPAPPPPRAPAPAPAPAHAPAPQPLVGPVRPAVSPQIIGIAAAAVLVLLAVAYFAFLRGPKTEITNTENITTTVPVAPATTTAPVVDQRAAIDQQLTDLRDRLRQQFARGDWQNGLTTAASAANLRKDDPQLQTILTDALAAARVQLTKERDAARGAGRTVVGTDTFQQGVRKDRSVDQLARNGQTGNAIRAAWEAVDLFKRAQTEAANIREEPKPATTTAIPVPATTTIPQQVPVTSTTPLATTSVAPLPPPQPPQPPPPVSEEPAIRAILSAYAQAFSALDADAVRRLHPTVNQDALRRGFRDMKSQRVQIQDPQIQVAGSTATVSCTIVTAVVPRVGSAQTNSRQTQLKLEKRGDGWVIVDRR